jgi:threonine aldolase
MSKQRYTGAQVATLLEGGLWLELARHANGVAASLAEVLTDAGVPLAITPDGNEVFAKLNTDQAAKLATAGAQCYPWPSLGAGVHRFVAGWASSLDDVAFVQRVLKTG